ncbi:NAD(P)-dependent oxidoreductase [Tardiphaga sp.]|uniref:NAD(P)-dependent oxidoreductase n=1 Tax=Tardiphaga sp. TaxID=1926292 RepID=UPI0025D6AC77|nr:NAD(P)-dependent oxidoreductase [Tardiphaga sp.]
MDKQVTIGFIGLGVMGGPMCRNMAVKHTGRLVAFDLDSAAFSILQDTRAEFVSTIEALAAHSDVIFLSLPGGKQVTAVTAEIARHAKSGTTIVDLSTTSVAVAREVDTMLAGHGIAFADAPVARTREAAQQGKLSVMVGAPDALYARIRPFIDMIASDITHGGKVGTGQVLKLVNNMLVFEHVAALAEMMVVAERAGVAPEVMLDAVSKGSGDSFVLRNHGRKAMLTRSFPDKAFPPEYVLKDISYVLELAEASGVKANVAETAQRYYQGAIDAGLGGRYFPVVLELIEKQGKP